MTTFSAGQFHLFSDLFQQAVQNDLPLNEDINHRGHFWNDFQWMLFAPG